MSTTSTVIGPEQHGQHMSLDDFENATGLEGFSYELSRGVVTVIDVPHRRHLALIHNSRMLFYDYHKQHPGRIHTIAAGHECKILVKSLDSERHPDVAIYKTAPPPHVQGSGVWAVWIPEIVIEIVTSSSIQRDYHEKPEEYLQFGVQEYWIVDIDQNQMTVLQRSRGNWEKHIIQPPEQYRSHLLPEFPFNLEEVFEVAD